MSFLLAPMSITKTDFLIIGAGIIGLCVAKHLRERYPNKSILLLEKELSLAFHASGRNSGVLHAGFYYASDSLKAKFTLQGNQAWKAFCQRRNLPLNENGKVVVAANIAEIEGVKHLYQRGCQNGVPLKLIDMKELAAIEPLAKTCELALYSPQTATISPTAIIETLAKELLKSGVEIALGEGFLAKIDQGVIKTTRHREIHATKIVNAAGMYADKIAQLFGCGENYLMLPFKGLYLKYHGDAPPLKVSVYPVPDLNFPFLGVHFTVNAFGENKIGPTAIPAFWRENYNGWSRFSGKECLAIMFQQTKLFLRNDFNFRQHAMMEIKKFYKPYLIKQAKKLVNAIDLTSFQEWSAPGIRAQLLNLATQKLEQDFIIESRADSVHILNAVSPAFTCALPFTQWIVEHYL